eukprot:3521867-Prymnesium_polylepis.1
MVRHRPAPPLAHVPPKRLPAGLGRSRRRRRDAAPDEAAHAVATEQLVVDVGRRQRRVVLQGCRDLGRQRQARFGRPHDDARVVKQEAVQAEERKRGLG